MAYKEIPQLHVDALLRDAEIRALKRTLASRDATILRALEDSGLVSADTAGASSPPVPATILTSARRTSGGPRRRPRRTGIRGS